MADTISQALLQSLMQSPLLITDLPGARQFDRSLLGGSNGGGALNVDQKLGHLYEEALSLLLDNADVVSLLGQHIQIFNQDKKTLGELDFIVRDLRSGTFIHLELGVKFYLAYQEGGEVWRFPGPNARDNWPKKLARLQDHQLRVTQQPMVQDMLRERYGIDAVEARQLIYGCLFVPIAHRGLPPKLDYMAEDARTGRWLYADHWPDYFAEDAEVFVIPKSLWPVLPDAGVKHLYARCTAAEFLEHHRKQGAMFTLDDLDNTYFLAPDGWPH